MSERSIIRRIRGTDTSDGAGVRLKRIIGQPGLDMLDPFLLLDEFRSDSADDYLAGFPEHPHRGFETVTYMLAGHMRHGDNHGNQGDLGPGSVQWMTAGRGILHSEMPQQENGLMWGFQLWVNLPAKDKLTEPRYQDIDPARIPSVRPQDGVEVKIIAGEVFGAAGPVAGIATQPVYLDIALQPGAQLEVPLPEGHSAFAYVFDGADAQVAGDVLSRSELAVLSKGGSVRIGGREAPSRVLLVAGKPLGESVARYGPFVMNTPAEIHQAIADFRDGKF
ncbi:pirin family protein [Dyella sp. LX-66]|uniref:pirin family protein n=1 Tax=unclassified Dyella TaxID=2634549 RepID=UPI001BE068F7|nr:MULTISPECIES: pirin family protein [unclassified Dyella]MBT2117721.1 pirin family protein [Dyella sp. LX-1]MBT2141236.1 pirin family protein [Dyella sp. LX-66]